VIVSGPEIRIVGLASGHDFTIKEAQAAYAIYLLHFICRMHASILETLLDDDGAPLATCDWQISPDNFTGDFNGPMAKTLFRYGKQCGNVGPGARQSPSLDP
jgi:hypothetical protein